MDPELELLQRWRAGDNRAGDRLLVAYHKLIWRTVATKVPEHAIEDLVQKVVLALLERRDAIESDLKFRSYAMAITRNVICGYYRERNREPVELVDVAQSSVRDLGAGPSSIVLAREQERLLLEALRSLSLDDQFVLELHYWERMTGPELGAVFDCLEPNIRSRLRRAKGRLEAKLVELSRQHRVLAETITTLDSWAAGLRDALEPHLRGRG
jgi:RNA polymerase sigma-70 factor (ECF subfamily)